ncbi:3-oxoacid CoA-transferase subunit A [Salinisphaera aquimarina]|uniref:3-oxoacid CoA-transferase subunit A n=1 Tax=Salinisphaera aquimarina TaxID=2094031 RepID=A0ABV7ELM9_9GAMM
MVNKIVDSMAEAIGCVRDGDTVMCGGFGSSGIPFNLIDALLEHGARDLTIVANNAGVGETGIAKLLRENRLRKVICSYPRSPGSVWFERRYEERAIELELVPQGTLAERIRAAGAGIGGFFTPTGYGTGLAEGKRTEVFDGLGHVLERPLAADVALLKANRGDRWGNLDYHTTARNFNPIMATAAATVIAEVSEIVALGAIDPEHVVTPGIFVDHVIEVEQVFA